MTIASKVDEYGAVKDQIKSSEKRLKCSIISAAKKRNSATKSRSLTASMLLGLMAPKPRSVASATRSMPKGLPASAPLPSGITSASAFACAKRLMSRMNICA